MSTAPTSVFSQHNKSKTPRNVSNLSHFGQNYRRQTTILTGGQLRAKNYNTVNQPESPGQHSLKLGQNRKHSLPPMDETLKWSQAQQINQRMVKTGYGLKRNSTYTRPQTNLTSPKHTLPADFLVSAAEAQPTDLSVLRSSTGKVGNDEFGLTEKQQEELKNKMNRTKKSRVAQKDKQRHFKSVERVMRKLSKLKEHYGNSQLIGTATLLPSK